MHISLPYHIYVWVNNNELGPGMPSGVTKGILHGLFAKPGQRMLTHVLLESGAHWSGLPLIALRHKQVSDALEPVEPWGCMGSQMTATHMPYLEGLGAVTLKDNLSCRHSGIVVDWSDGYSRYPQEHKPLSLLLLDNGGFALLPNNYFRVYDKHFTVDLDKAPAELRHYRRGEKIYWEE